MTCRLQAADAVLQQGLLVDLLVCRPVTGSAKSLQHDFVACASWPLLDTTPQLIVRAALPRQPLRVCLPLATSHWARTTAVPVPAIVITTLVSVIAAIPVSVISPVPLVVP